MSEPALEQGQISLDQAQVERGERTPGGTVTDPRGNEITILKVPKGTGTFSDAREAVRAIRAAREKAYNLTSAEPEAPPATPRVRTGEPPKLVLRGLENNDSPQARAAPEPEVQPQPAAPDAPPQEESVEQQASPEIEAVEPPIEAPKSLTKEEREDFANWPRGAQEAFVRRESDRQRQFTLKSQELAEQRRNFETRQSEAERQRAEYEQRLPQLVASLQSHFTSQFPEIKTREDLDRLAVDNPPRFNQYMLAQSDLANAQQEMATARQAADVRSMEQWRTFSAEQDRKFAEAAPGFTDEMRQRTRPYLESLGFTKEQINHSWAWDGTEVSRDRAAREGVWPGAMRDYRVQLLIHDALQWQAIKSGAVKRSIEMKKNPVPPALRPGSARAPSAGQDLATEIASLKQQMQTASVRDQLRLGAKLQQAQRKAGLTAL